MIKNVPDFACLQALSTISYSLVNKGDTAKTTPLLWFSMQFCLKEYTEMKYLPSNMSERLCVT